MANRIPPPKQPWYNEETTLYKRGGKRIGERRNVQRHSQLQAKRVFVAAMLTNNGFR
jgi:hypothetical protein